MKFFTNRIPTNSSGNFGDLIKKIAESNQNVKTASNKTNRNVVAEAGVDDDGEGMRKNVHGVEGSPSDQNGKAEEDGENMVVEPASLGKGKSKESGAKDEVKIASEGSDAGDNDDQEGVSTGKFPDEFEPKQEAQEDGKADVKASNKKQVKKAGELPEALKEHMFKKKDAKEDSKDNKEDDKEDAKTENKEDDKKEACSYANSNSGKFKKIANLTSKEKARLKAYYDCYYPSSYSDALIQDK